MALKEYTMTVNEISRPTVLEGADAAYALLVRLLLLEPGTNQAYPDMGVGLVSRYRYSLADNVPKLILEYKEQIDKYLPSLTLTDITSEMKGKTLILKVNIDNKIIYPLIINSETMTLSDL